MNIRDSFDRVGFTPEEKMDLTARLERAAELEENMTSATKRKIKRISGGMIFGVAAAAIMTVGALAAVISPGLRSWFDTTTPGASSALEDGIYRLDRSLTHEGWTVTLDECVGDDSSLYVCVDITAPEGTVFAPQEDRDLHIMYYIGSMGMNLQEIPDEDPTDNRKSFILQSSWQAESLRGQAATIKVGPIEEHWWTDALTEGAQYHKEALLDYEWVFEDVKLDFPDQTVRLTPNVEVPWIDGTTTVTRLEVSPLSILVELEGGSCATYRNIVNGDPYAYDDAVQDQETLVFDGGIVMTFGTPSKTWQDKVWEMEKSLELGAVLKDGTRVDATANVGQPGGTREGIEGPETPFFATCRRYSPSGNGPTGLVDPTQVDHVTVCGVDIPVDPAASLPASHFAQVPAPIPAVPEKEDTPQEAAPTVGTVTAGKGLNVRSGPGTGYKVVDSLRKGAEVTILGEDSGFYQVDYAGGKTGYVSKSYVTVK